MVPRTESFFLLLFLHSTIHISFPLSLSLQPITTYHLKPPLLIHFPLSLVILSLDFSSTQSHFLSIFLTLPKTQSLLTVYWEEPERERPDTRSAIWTPSICLYFPLSTQVLLSFSIKVLVWQNERERYWLTLSVSFFIIYIVLECDVQRKLDSGFSFFFRYHFLPT